MPLMTRHSRREFLQTTAAVTLGAAIGPGAQDQPTPQRRTTPFAAPPIDRVRIGFVGVGRQGSVHVDNLLKIEGAEIRAICDIVDWKVARAQAAVVAADQPKPAGYARGPRDFERMCAEQELDRKSTRLNSSHVEISYAVFCLKKKKKKK